MNETANTNQAIVESVCNENEFLLQFQIKFDTNPNDVGIVLNTKSIKNDTKPSSSSSSSLWNFVPGYSFNSTEQVGTTNTLSICLKLTSSYTLNITDLGCDGLVSSTTSSGTGTDNDGNWQIQSDGIPLIQYNGQCSDPTNSTTNTSSSNMRPVINECGLYSTCLYKISNQTFVGRCTTMSCSKKK